MFYLTNIVLLTQKSGPVKGTPTTAYKTRALIQFRKLQSFQTHLDCNQSNFTNTPTLPHIKQKPQIIQPSWQPYDTTMKDDNWVNWRWHLRISIWRWGRGSLKSPCNLLHSHLEQGLLKGGEGAKRPVLLWVALAGKKIFVIKSHLLKVWGFFLGTRLVAFGEGMGQGWRVKRPHCSLFFPVG